MQHDRARGIPRRMVGPGLAFACLGLVAGCTELLEIDVPTQVAATTLDDPAQASLLVQSAITEFECGFANYILGAGMHGDELANASGWAAYWDFDRRTSDPAGGVYASLTCDQTPGGVYTPLQTARFLGDDTAAKLEGWTDAEVAPANRSDLIAQAYAYAGYATLVLGEGMCSMAIDLGPELTRDQTMTEAENRFTAAIDAAQAAGNDAILNMARVGRARARNNKGDATGAAADAMLIPAGFVMNATYGDAVFRRYNQVYNSNQFSRFAVVEDDFRNLTVEGVPDTRVPASWNGDMTVGVVVRELWITTKLTGLTGPLPIARYEEAQLILAEAQGGTQAVTIIDNLRAAHGLPPYSGGTSAAEITALIIQERSRELYLESQHLGDKLRFGLPFTPAAGTVFPHVGGLYGALTCFPLPLRERQNNPNVDD